MTEPPSTSAEVSPSEPVTAVVAKIPPPLPRPAVDRWQWSFQAGLLALSSAVLATAVVLSVEQENYVRLPVVGIVLPELCHFRRTLGIPCPGCGLTRCFISLAHGELAAAWHFHPVGMLFFLVVVFQIPFRSWQLLRLHRGLPLFWLGRWVTWFLAVLAVLMILQWLVRVCA